MMSAWLRSWSTAALETAAGPPSTRMRVTGSPAGWALAGTLSTPPSSSRDTRTPQIRLRDFVYSINRSDSKVSGRYRETNVTRESNEQP